MLDQAPDAFDHVTVDRVGRTVTVGALPPSVGDVGVLTAGTTSTCPSRARPRRPSRPWAWALASVADVGVAGLHRLLSRVEDIGRADVVVAVAGMDGALPGVVGWPGRGPGDRGADERGLRRRGRRRGRARDDARRLQPPGVVVVNIDNGFGAAAHAAKIVRRG